VLANEQVSAEGVCWRCKSAVTKRNLKQWFFKITDYAQKLLDGLDKLERWPESIKAMQRYWIGRSEGTEIVFPIAGNVTLSAAKGLATKVNSDFFVHQGGTQNDTLRSIPVFTTRPDTVYGVTFMAIAPEHPLVKELTTPEQKKAVEEYAARAAAKSEIDRAAVGEKDGVFTGSFAVNPLSGEQVSSGSPTMSCFITAPAWLWACRRTTSAISCSLKI